MLDGRAAIPDDAQPSGFRALCRADVTEIELEPDGWGVRGDRIVDDRIEELTASEDVDKIDARVSRDVYEVVVRLLAVDDRATQSWIHWNDPKALAPQVARHGVARSCGIGGVADDSYGALAREETLDEGGVVQLSHLIAARGSLEWRIGGRIIASEMPPRAPVIWSTLAVGSERFHKRLDERHRELSVQAKLRARTYRRSRALPMSEESIRLRADFLAALGRLSSFETTSLRLSRCRYQVQLAERADDITRDYFQLWQVIARRGGQQWPLGERDAERMDFFATQLGRLEGIADALVLAGRNVRLFPLPPMPWLAVERASPSYS